MTFDTLGLEPKIVKAVLKAGYTTPTSIQSKVIPKILNGFDIRASAQTGTGKTAGFLLPAIHQLLKPAEIQGKGPRILILVPTRELASQVCEQAEKYSSFLRHLKTVCVVGGVPYHKQERKLLKPHDILVATPGRLIDFLNQKKINLSRVEMLVLDEADRMLDMGFLEPVESICDKTPKTRQTLLFSATLQGSVLKLSERLLNKPMEIAVKNHQDKHESITQKLYYTHNMGHKVDLLDHFLKQDELTSAIVFTSTKRHADELAKELREKEHKAVALHGDMSQHQRTRSITKLKKGSVNVIVATDVAARGIDVQNISHVINFDLPRNPEDYVHRIGRTGRAGNKGLAYSFASIKDKHLVKKIASYTKQTIDVHEIKGLEPREQKQKRKQSRPPFHRKKRTKRTKR